jgi:hypothetical protein
MMATTTGSKAWRISDKKCDALLVKSCPKISPQPNKRRLKLAARLASRKPIDERSHRHGKLHKRVDFRVLEHALLPASLLNLATPDRGAREWYATSGGASNLHSHPYTQERKLDALQDRTCVQFGDR